MEEKIVEGLWKFYGVAAVPLAMSFVAIRVLWKELKDSRSELKSLIKQYQEDAIHIVENAKSIEVALGRVLDMRAGDRDG